MQKQRVSQSLSCRWFLILDFDCSDADAESPRVVKADPWLFPAFCSADGEKTHFMDIDSLTRVRCHYDSMCTKGKPDEGRQWVQWVVQLQSECPLVAFCSKFLSTFLSKFFGAGKHGRFRRRLAGPSLKQCGQIVRNEVLTVTNSEIQALTKNVADALLSDDKTIAAFSLVVWASSNLSRWRDLGSRLHRTVLTPQTMNSYDILWHLVSSDQPWFSSNGSSILDSVALGFRLEDGQEAHSRARSHGLADDTDDDDTEALPWAW